MVNRILKRVAQKIYDNRFDIVDLVPFYTTNTIRRKLNKDTRSILDIGCGHGKVMRLINKRMKIFSVGIDAWTPSLNDAKRKGVFDDYVVCDARFIPFRRKSFDVTMCLEVIEHLSKADGLMLIKGMEEIARGQVIISTPVGFIQHGVAENSPFQIHQSGWSPLEFRKMGYEVRGFGFRFIYGNRIPPPVRLYSSFILSCALAPLTYFYPRIANVMVCIKDVVGADKGKIIFRPTN